MRLTPTPAAQFQATTTRVRMGIGLWLRALMGVFLAWSALTIYLVWHATGRYFPQLQHAYFWRWASFSTMLRIPVISTIALRCSIPANGAWYPVGPVTDWMNGPQMYYQSFPSWYWHYGIRTALIPFAFAILLAVQRFRIDSPDSEHLSGLRLLTPRHHNRQLNGGMLKRILYGPARGIRLGKTVIPERSECEHFLITGNPGAGKSTAMRAMLKQIEERGQSAIIIDSESEYVQEFYCEGRGDFILNPLDRRCPYWSPWSELRDESFSVDAAAMAASLIRGVPATRARSFFRIRPAPSPRRSSM